MKTNIFCRIDGDHFSPKKLQENTNLLLADALEVGEKVDWGKKTQISDYGRANLFAPKNIELDEVDWLAEQIFLHHEQIKNCGAEEMTLWIVLSIESIGNWAISAESMEIFGKLGIKMCLSVYAE